MQIYLLKSAEELELLLKRAVDFDGGVSFRISAEQCDNEEFPAILRDLRECALMEVSAERRSLHDNPTAC